MYEIYKMKLVILDRDGVINQDSPDYVKAADEWIPIPGSIEAIAQLTGADYEIVIATNQSGIGRGLFNERELAEMHTKMHNLVEQAGGKITEIFYCPHKPEDECDCRKPKTGLLEAIAEKFATQLKGIPFVGDSLKDIEAARTMGCEPILVKTGKGLTTLKQLKTTNDILVCKNLKEAVTRILAVY